MKCVEANVSEVTALQTPPQVFSRLSWANERPASCSFSFGKGKKSAGSKFGDKGWSAISGMALAVNQCLAAALMTGELFQPQISVKNDPNSKIR